MSRISILLLYYFYSKISCNLFLLRHASLRSKLRELFPKTAFAGGIALSDLGVDLLEKMLDMNPNTVRFDALGLC